MTGQYRHHGSPPRHRFHRRPRPRDRADPARRRPRRPRVRALPAARGRRGRPGRSGAQLVVVDLSYRDAVVHAADDLDDGEPIDAVVHNAGVVSHLLVPVNVVAPYLMTALLTAPTRHVYLSSGIYAAVGHGSTASTGTAGARPTATRTRSSSSPRWRARSPNGGPASGAPPSTWAGSPPRWVASARPTTSRSGPHAGDPRHRRRHDGQWRVLVPRGAAAPARRRRGRGVPHRIGPRARTGDRRGAAVPLRRPGPPGWESGRVDTQAAPPSTRLPGSPSSRRRR